MASNGNIYRVKTVSRLTSSCERDRGEFWTLSRSVEVMAEIRFLGAGAAAGQSESEFPLRNAADSDVLIFYRGYLCILLLINLPLRRIPSAAITGRDLAYRLTIASSRMPPLPSRLSRKDRRQLQTSSKRYSVIPQLN